MQPVAAGERAAHLSLSCPQEAPKPPQILLAAQLTLPLQSWCVAQVEPVGPGLHVGWCLWLLQLPLRQSEAPLGQGPPAHCLFGGAQYPAVHT